MKWMLLVFSIFAISGTASATVLSGSINFAGGYTTDTGDKNTATVFTFLNPTDVTAASGDFAPLDGGTVTYNALDINAVPTTLWTAMVGGVDYSFALNEITLDEIVFSTIRVIQGTGLFTVGADTEFGTWEFTTQGAGTGEGTDAKFSFSAGQVAVTAPSIIWLIGSGLGLVGMVTARNRLN